LNSANVGEAVRKVWPFAVDVASGVESAPGAKDPAKLRDFFAAVEGANRALQVTLFGEDSNMSKAFSGEDLSKIVTLAGQALEAEDRYICGCFQRNPTYGDSDLVPGIKLLCDERFYQRVVHRALLASFPYFVKLEYKGFDIALFESWRDAKPAALGEIKDAMAPGLAEDVRKIRKDIEKLRQKEGCGHFLLIFAVVGKDAWPGWVDELLKDLRCSKEKHYEYAFDTANDNNGTIERQGWVFAVIGVLLRAGSAEP
jgi:hypothetical protein